MSAVSPRSQADTRNGEGASRALPYVALMSRGRGPAERGADDQGFEIPQTLGRARSKVGLCGMCGRDGPLTRTHVPPQAVGNRNAVQRRQIVSVASRASNGRGLAGGLHVPGLCRACNGLAGTWDPAYVALHKALGPASFAESGLHLPARISVPDVPIAVGAAARSMLAGASALNPMLRTHGGPELAPLLLDCSPFAMPAGLDLRLAWGIGRNARITGSVMGQYVLGYEGLNRTIGNLTAAQAHYPPIAWQLLHSGQTDLCDEQGWPSINHWTEYPTQDLVPLNTVCSSLPVVYQANLHPKYGEGWIEMSADENCHLVVCHDIAAAGRNDPCPCGSGTKHKRCCGAG